MEDGEHRFWVTRETAENLRRGVILWNKAHLYPDCSAVRRRKPEAVTLVLRIETREYPTFAGPHITYWHQTYLAGEHIGYVCRLCLKREQRGDRSKPLLKPQPSWQEVLGVEQA
jgi:hypothetical protein